MRRRMPRTRAPASAPAPRARRRARRACSPGSRRRGARGADPTARRCRRSTHAGNTLLVAVDAVEPATAMRTDDRAPDAAGAPPLGATLGFLGWSDGLHLHSHMNAVDPARARPRHRRRAEAASARGLPRARRRRDALDLRPADPPQRAPEPRATRRRGRRVPPRLLRRARRRHHGHRPQRPLRGALAPRLAAHARARSPEGRSPTGGATAASRSSPTSSDVRADDPEAAARLREASREAFAALGRPRGLRVELDAGGRLRVHRDDPDREA